MDRAKLGIKSKTTIFLQVVSAKNKEGIYIIDFEEGDRDVAFDKNSTFQRGIESKEVIDVCYMGIGDKDSYSCEVMFKNNVKINFLVLGTGNHILLKGGEAICYLANPYASRIAEVPKKFMADEDVIIISLESV